MGKYDGIGVGAMRLEGNPALFGLIEFLRRARRHHRLKTLSYLCPQWSVWLVEDPYLALAYSDVWIEHYAAVGWPMANLAESPLDWIFLPKLQDALRQIRMEAGACSDVQDLFVPLRGADGTLVGLLSACMDGGDPKWAGHGPEFGKVLSGLAEFAHRY